MLIVIKTILYPMLRPAAFILLLIFATQSYAQNVNMEFTLYLFGDSIGHSTITKTKDGNDIHYHLQTTAQAKILWITHSNLTNYDAVYRDGKLVSATYYEINNGKKDRWSNIKFDGKQYQADTYNGKKTFTEAPVHSIGPMYCDGYAPGKKRFFNESEADFNDLSFPEANTIEFKSSDGKRNIYHFKSGQISDVECHTSIATIKIKRTK